VREEGFGGDRGVKGRWDKSITDVGTNNPGRKRRRGSSWRGEPLGLKQRQPYVGVGGVVLMCGMGDRDRPADGRYRNSKGPT
jgi:hypothetical protein